MNLSKALRGLWPALPALLIAWVGGSSFLEKYPRPAQGQRARADASRGPDTLMAMVRSGMAASLAVSDSVVPGGSGSPFRPIRPPRPVAGRPGGAMQVPPPPRNFHLKGTVGDNVATLVNNSGARVIVKVGERVDSAVVISIEPNKVVLKDRAGRFDLLLER